MTGAKEAEIVGADECEAIAQRALAIYPGAANTYAR
jgi:hypothetical protein